MPASTDVLGSPNALDSRRFALEGPAQQAAAAALGERYVVEQLIGEGAFARTYRARDTRLARTVAVKLLRTHLAADPSFLDRFRREARAAARVDHPNVVHVYDYGGQDDVSYLVLQYVPGRDLKRLIEEDGPLPPADAIRIAREVLSGLAAIHAAGIVHRDIKPQNVLIDWDGVPRLTDFGIAFEPGQAGLTTLTNHGTTLGTPAYMAPEQARGEPVREATDLYSVGVVLFEMLTGRLPFRAESSLAMMMAHVEQAPPPPSSIQPGVPPELDAVVLRALAKAPGERFASAREMERALLDALIRIRDGSSAAERAARPTRVRAAVPPPAEVTSTTPLPSVTAPVLPADPTRVDRPPRQDHPQRRRGSGWLIPALLALVAVVALVTALVKATGDGNGGGDAGNTAPPTNTNVVLAPVVETPEPTPTKRTIIFPKDPIVTYTPTDEPAPTETAEPEPTETPEPVTEEPADAPTIAPSDDSRATEEPTEPPATEDKRGSEPVSQSFSAEDWRGGLTRTDSAFLGRPWTALYGSASGYGEATLSFKLDDAPEGGGTLVITGVDDEAGGDSPITIEVNRVEIFSGPSPFPNWDGRGNEGPWTAVSFPIPDGVLKKGTNRITITNHDPSNRTNSPPYVLLSDTTVTVD